MLERSLLEQRKRVGELFSFRKDTKPQAESVFLDSAIKAALLDLKALHYPSVKGHDLGMADNEGHVDDDGRHDGGEDGDTKGRMDGDPDNQGGETRSPPGGEKLFLAHYFYNPETLFGVPVAPSSTELSRIIRSLD